MSQPPKMGQVIGLGLEQETAIDRIVAQTIYALERHLKPDQTYIILGATELAIQLEKALESIPCGHFFGRFQHESLYNEPAYSYTHFLLKWEYFELDPDDLIFILCEDPKHYRTATRRLLHVLNFRGCLIMPHLQQNTWSMQTFDPHQPILTHTVTRSGTLRFWPVFSHLLKKLGRKVDDCREPDEDKLFMQLLRRPERRPLRQPKNPIQRIQKSMLSRELYFPTQTMIDHFHLSTAQILNAYEVRLMHMHVFSPIDIFLRFSHFKLVALIRDPRDVMLSFYYAYINKGYYMDDTFFHSGFPDQLKENLLSHLFHQGWKYLSRTKIISFPNLNTLAQHYLTCIEDPRISVIRFEDIHQDNTRAYRNLLDELGLLNQPYYPLEEKTFKQALKGGSFHFQTNGQRERGAPMDANILNYGSYRRGIVGDWKNHLTPRHKEEIKALIGDMLIQLGYENDTHW